MKIAVGQIACALGEVETNLEKIRAFSERAKAKGAELIVFPELSDTGYAMAVVKEKASAWQDGAVARLQEMAREISIALVAGVTERVGEEIFNSLVAIDARGEIISRYRKAHLFEGTTENERACFRPGDRLESFKLDGLTFAPTICYDLRFPEIYRAQVFDLGAQIFLLVSAWPLLRAEHLRTLALARAIENQCYLVLANRMGKDGDSMLCGGSAIIDPLGVLVAAASAEREELICGEVEEEVLRAARTRMPVLEHRRPELFA